MVDEQKVETNTAQVLRCEEVKTHKVLKMSQKVFTFSMEATRTNVPLLLNLRTASLQHSGLGAAKVADKLLMPALI